MNNENSPSTNNTLVSNSEQQATSTPLVAESKKGTNKLLTGCLVVGAILVLTACGLGAALMVWLAVSPEGGVRVSNQMEEYAIEYNEEHDLLEDGEEVLAYYDYTIRLNGSESAFVTDRRVVYQKDGKVTDIMLSDIEDIQYTEDSISGYIITIESKSGERLGIEIASLNNGDIFIDVLYDSWEAVDSE